MYERILVPIDGSSTSRRGFDEALKLAKRLGTALHLLNIVDVPMVYGDVAGTLPPEDLLAGWQASAEQLVADAIAEARAAGVQADGIVRRDPGERVCDVIVQEAVKSQAGLIVMGTHGRRGLRRLALGSDAELVLRATPVPVLLVRDPAP